MNFKIDLADGTPIYLQIVNQVKRMVAAGRLKPEAPLPSVRQLALDLTVNPNTVARAYLELEHQGVISTRHGQGSYVCAHPAEASRRERRKVVAALFEKAIVEAVNAGAPPSEIDDIYGQLVRRYKLEKP